MSGSDTPEQQDDGWDFEGEWAEARAASAEHSAEPLAEISPYSLLYTGFLLGPGASFLAVFVLMGRRFRLRTALFALGICGASWSIIQGATLGLSGLWLPWQIQTLRTSLNFVAGLILVVFALRSKSIAWRHDRHTLLNTGVFLVLLAAIFGFLSNDLLFWLGR